MTIRMEEAEFFSNPTLVMQHVANGDAVRVERDGQELAVLHDPHVSVQPPVRPMRQVIERLKALEAEQGPAMMDEEFAAGVREAHEFFNQPIDSSKWD